MNIIHGKYHEDIVKASHHPTKHDCLIKVMLFYFWINNLIHSATQNTINLNLSMKFILKLFFYSAVNDIVKASHHPTKHDCLIKVMLFYFWINNFIHSATQNTINLNLSMKFILKLFFYSAVNDTCNYISNIIYKRDSVQFHCHFNCVSLWSKFDDLENCISNMKFQFDVIALSKTWLRHDI